MDGSGGEPRVAAETESPVGGADASNWSSQSSLATSPAMQHAKSLPTLRLPASLKDTLLTVAPEPRRSRTLFEGLLGCLRPMWAIVGGGGGRGAALCAGSGSFAAAALPPWTVDMLDISDLQFVTSGSQGAVFYGIYRGQEVAVKKFTEPPEVSLLDLRHLRELRHPHVVQFVGACVSEPNCTCLLMEYCPFGNLYDFYTTKVDCLPAATLLEWARQLAGGMAYLHERRIAHGDLKSPNILVCDGDVLKISDFGLVRVPELESQGGGGAGASRQVASRLLQLYGTVRWMSPEQCRQESWGYKADVYSYGVIVWELLFQEVPYRNVDRWAVVLGVGQGTLSLPLPRHTPGTARTLMESCWSARPKSRPSFQTILNSLDMSCTDVLVLSDGDLRILRKAWAAEIQQALSSMRQEDQKAKMEADLIRQRREELQHASDIRQHYERKLRRVDNLQMDLTNLRLRLTLQARAAHERSRELQRFVRDRCCRSCKQLLAACFHDSGLGCGGGQLATSPASPPLRAAAADAAVQTEPPPPAEDEPRLRERPGRRPLPGAAESKNTDSSSDRSQVGGPRAARAGGSGSPAVLLSTELLTRELQDNMADSLSDKEAAFDQFKHAGQRRQGAAPDSAATDFNVTTMNSENFDGDYFTADESAASGGATSSQLHPLRRSEGCVNGFRPNSAFV